MKSENRKCTAYDKRKALTSCKNSSLSENLRPVSLTEAEKADMHGGQSSKNVEAASAEESSSPVPSGISMEIVAAMFSLAEKPEIKVVFDQAGTPTYALDLAEAIFRILEDGSYVGRCGVYHYSGEGVCSWYDFAKMIAEYSGHTGCRILPCHSGEFPSKVARPAYSVLDKTKIKETFGVCVPYWTDSLKRCLCSMGEMAPGGAPAGDRMSVKGR